MGAKKLRINEWVTPQNRKFSYKIYWPYEEVLNPQVADVNVHLNLPKGNRRYVGTFITIGQMKKWFEECKSNRNYASGTYIPGSMDIIVERISHTTIEDTIEDLLEKGQLQLQEYFIKRRSI